MSSRLLVALAALLIGLMAAANSAAASREDVEACRAANTYDEPYLALEVCGKVLAAADTTKTDLAFAHFRQGEAFYWTHRPGMAIPALDRAIELNPEFNAAYRRRGWAYERLGQYAAAARDFSDYLEREPDDPYAHFAIGYLAGVLGASHSKVMAAYERVLKIDPEHYLTRFNIANINSCANCDIARAYAEFDRIIAAGREAVGKVQYGGRRDKHDFDFYAHVRHRRAQLFIDGKRLNDARADADWLVTNYPKIGSGFELRAEIQYRQRDFAGALRDADMAIDLDEFSQDAIQSKMKALLRLKRDEELLDYASNVLNGIASGETQDYAYYYRGLVHKHAGRFELALRDMEQSIALGGWFARVATANMIYRGYFAGKYPSANGNKLPDTSTKEFRNGLEACIIDPEC